MDNSTERNNGTAAPTSGNGHAKPPPLPLRTAGQSLAPAAAKLEARDLSTVELVKEISSEVGHLAQKQIELAKTEIKADLKSEATMIGGLGIAALGAAATANLLLVTVVLALAQVMSGWKAGLLVSGVVLLGAAIIAWVAWKRRVRSPLARTQRTLREDVEWTKERLA